MTVKDFIKVLSQAPQDAEIVCEDYYSNLSPLGSLWLYKKSNSLVVSQYICDTDIDDCERVLYPLL